MAVWIASSESVLIIISSSVFSFFNTSILCLSKFFPAKSLKFLSLDGLYKALCSEKRNVNYPQFSDHYFTGDYPIKPTDSLGLGKVTQLSLLSSKSNN